MELFVAHRLRPLAHVAVAAVLALVAGACSDDNASDGDTASEDTQDAIEIPASTVASAGSVAGGGSGTATGSGGGGTGTTAANTNGGTGTGGSTPADTATSTSAAPGGSTGTAAPGVSATTISLKEWSLTAGATTLKAGSVTFNVTNDGSFTHEFVVIKGTYETMPQSAIGAVLEDQLPAKAVIGRIDSIRAGDDGVLSTDLAAGPYTLLCNIASGPNSHAGKGQHQNITIA